MNYTLKEVPINDDRAFRALVAKRRLQDYLARARTQREATYVRGYYRPARRNRRQLWDAVEMLVLIPTGLVLAGYAMYIGFK